jgi:FMN-dependent NADH-azoreductase
MTNILAINSSVGGEGSVTRVLVAEAVAQLVAANPGARVVTRDLAGETVPHLTPENVNGVRAQAVTPAELAARARSDELIAELKVADVIVVGVPMYNFSVPTTLRAWFDYVARPGETFSYSAEGPKGLVTGKKVIIVEARGGLYSEGPAQAADFQEPYLRHIFGFIGMTDLAFIHAEKIGFGPEARAEAISHATRQLTEVTGLPLAA